MQTIQFFWYKANKHWLTSNKVLYNNKWLNDHYAVQYTINLATPRNYLPFTNYGNCFFTSFLSV